MVQFAHPAFLALLLLLPWLVWRAGSKPRAALAFSDVRLLSSKRARPGWWRRWVGAGLRGLAMVCLVGALAGIRWPDRGAPIATQGISIQLLVDVSGSMGEADVARRGSAPTRRLELMKEVLERFVLGGVSADGKVFPGWSGDPVGLVAFATWPDSRCPLTLDHQALWQVLRREQLRVIPTEQTTNIGDAIAWGLHRLEAARTPRKIIVLLSDGQHNEPPPALKPTQAAQLSASLGVPIYTIDTGPAEPDAASASGGQASVEEGRKTLAEVASLTGGKTYRAVDMQQMLNACGDIDRLERREVAGYATSRYREGFRWFGLASFVLWVSVMALERTCWLPVP